ncbi:MAG: bacterial regulatory, arsR family protein [Pseudobdellovibrio sp.]|jgi:DNA-binding MarR family transcriptional regulator|nr:bacterial regulatory, arsR family protein [Pseudobdellovibrio sp.]
MKIPDLDQTIHQPVRTKIMAYLINVGASDFTTLKKVLELTDGHMSTHMKLLVESGYVEMEKSFVDNKPKTTYSVSKEGKKKFSEYVSTLKKMVGG